MTAFSAEEQERRRRGIGASEAAAVLGLSPWATPADVWARKLGLVEDGAETDAQAFGVRVEGLICDWYGERTPGAALAPGRSIQEPGGRPVFATPDRFVIPAVSPERGWLLEAKSARSAGEAEGWGEEGTDAVPDHYLCQVAVQMACADLDRCDVAVLDLSARRLRVYTVRRDRDAESAILDRLAEWWTAYVVRKEAPPDTPAVLRWRRETTADLLPAPPEALFWLDALKTTRAERKRLEAAEAEAADALKEIIGPHAGLDGGAAGRVTWKAARESARVDWEAIARDLGVTPDVIAKFTTTTPGARRFLPTWPALKDGGEG